MTYKKNFHQLVVPVDDAMLLLFICCCIIGVCLLASNAIVNTAQTGVHATEPFFQLPANAWWTGGLSNSSATATGLRFSATVSG